MTEPCARHVLAVGSMLPRLKDDGQLFVLGETKIVQCCDDCGSCAPNGTMILDHAKHSPALELATTSLKDSKLLADASSQGSGLARKTKHWPTLHRDDPIRWNGRDHRTTHSRPSCWRTTGQRGWDREWQLSGPKGPRFSRKGKTEDRAQGGTGASPPHR